MSDVGEVFLYSEIPETANRLDQVYMWSTVSGEYVLIRLRLSGADYVIGYRLATGSIQDFEPRAAYLGMHNRVSSDRILAHQIVTAGNFLNELMARVGFLPMMRVSQLVMKVRLRQVAQGVRSGWSVAFLDRSRGRVLGYVNPVHS